MYVSIKMVSRQGNIDFITIYLLPIDEMKTQDVVKTQSLTIIFNFILILLSQETGLSGIRHLDYRVKRKFY